MKRPKSELIVEAHETAAPKFPVIDTHTHFGALLLGEDYASQYSTEEVTKALRAANVVCALSLELAWDQAYDSLRRKLSPSRGAVLAVGSVDVSRALSKDFEKLVCRQIADEKRKGAKALKLWKNMTLFSQEYFGRQVPLDDPCFKPVWTACAREGLPVIIHIADPPSFFKPVDEFNEYRSCLLQHPEWSFYKPGIPGFEEHMRMQEAVIAGNPHTTFIVAHVGSYAENLKAVGRWLDQYPNMYVDTAARLDQLGRQPYTAREFLIKYADRILFGTDFDASLTPQQTAAFYSTHYRFFQTADEYFDPPFADFPDHWRIYGLSLPDDVLRKLYYENAARLLDLPLPGQGA